VNNNGQNNVWVVIVVMHRRTTTRKLYVPFPVAAFAGISGSALAIGVVVPEAVALDAVVDTLVVCCFFRFFYPWRSTG
jgi:hypothetical protein